MSELTNGSVDKVKSEQDGDGCTEEVQLENDNNVVGDFSNLSKKQKKKMLKRKRYEEIRQEKRKLERERKKKRRLELREAGLPVPKRTTHYDMKNKVLSDVKVVIDLNFSTLMKNKDLRMLVKQVKSCYAGNRKTEHPFQLYITSFCKQIKGLFTKLQPGCVNWDANLEKEDYLHVFDSKKIVYLTSNSENVLDKLEKDKVYVIGGLVDHNQLKGLCYKLACEQGVSHARLPIGEYIKLNSRKVLTINHVFEILVKYQESNDWKDAFFKVIPRRKGVSELDIGAADKAGNTKISNNVN